LVYPAEAPLIIAHIEAVQMTEEVKADPIVILQPKTSQIALEQPTEQSGRVEQSVSTAQGYNPYQSYGGYGACAAYAKYRRSDIPTNWGNAGSWYYSAQASGWATGSEPRVGAVASLRGGNHVAVVEGVYNDGTILISEVNFDGNPNVDQRRTTTSMWDYIY
jgi:surface antigen